MKKIEHSTKLRRLTQAVLLSAAIFGLGALGVWGIIEGRKDLGQEAKREQPAKPAQGISFKGSEPVIMLDLATQRQSGLQTVQLQQTEYQAQQRAYAIVLDPQPLVDLYNNYALAKAQLKTAQAKLDASSAEFERENKLFRIPNSVVTIDKLQAVEATFHVDEAALTSAEAQLRTVSDTARQMWGPVLGQALIDEAPLLTRLVDRKDILLQVTLPVGESLITPPTTAFVESNNGTRYEVQFVSPATKTDPRIQGISYFYVAPAPSDLLSGMTVRAFLPAGTPIKGIIVPKTAVVWWQGRAWVYLRAGPEGFKRQEIATDESTGTGFFQAKGFSAGQEVVVQGAQTLLSEEFRLRPQPGSKDAAGEDED